MFEGSCVSFAVLLGDFLPQLADAAIDGACGGGCAAGSAGAAARGVLSRAPVSVALAGVAVLYPLALLRKLDALRFTSSASALCTVYLCVMLVALCVVGPRAPPAEINVGGGGTGIFIALPILLVGFTMHYNVPRLYAEMRGRSLPLFSRVVAAAFAAALLIYAGGALGGYLLKGAATPGDILNAFDEGEVPIVIARIALSVVVIACYPLAFNAMRAAVTSLLPENWARRLVAPAAADARTHAEEAAAAADSLDDDEDAGRAPLLIDAKLPPPPHQAPARASRSCLAAAAADWPHALLTLILVLLSLAVAILVPNIATVLSYKGALGGSLLVVILPALMHAALVQRRRGLKPGALPDEPLPELHWQWSDLVTTSHGALALAATALGTVLMVSGTLAAAAVI